MKLHCTVATICAFALVAVSFGVGASHAQLRSLAGTIADDNEDGDGVDMMLSDLITDAGGISDLGDGPAGEVTMELEVPAEGMGNLDLTGMANPNATEIISALNMSNPNVTVVSVGTRKCNGIGDILSNLFGQCVN